MLQNIILLLDRVSNIWENTYGWAEQYPCATALYLSSILAHTYSIIIDRGVGSPGHDRKVVDDLNATYKTLL